MRFPSSLSGFLAVRCGRHTDRFLGFPDCLLDCFQLFDLGLQFLDFFLEPDALLLLLPDRLLEPVPLALFFPDLLLDGLELFDLDLEFLDLVFE